MATLHPSHSPAFFYFFQSKSLMVSSLPRHRLNVHVHYSKKPRRLVTAEHLNKADFHIGDLTESLMTWPGPLQTRAEGVTQQTKQRRGRGAPGSGARGDKHRQAKDVMAGLLIKDEQAEIRLLLFTSLHDRTQLACSAQGPTSLLIITHTHTHTKGALYSCKGQ